MAEAAALRRALKESKRKQEATTYQARMEVCV